MSELFDPDRLNRTHVVTVRGKDDKFKIVLSDGSEIDWKVWINLTPKERGR
jgi:hypothetical protein